MVNMSLGNVELERQRYVNWLAAKVDGNLSYCGFTFSRLFNCLFDIPFVAALEKDINRAEDGNRLRVVYTTSHKINCEIRDLFQSNEGCTFLEFLVSIAMRANDILYDPEEDHTAMFFWDFARNIGLDSFDDEGYGRNWDMFKLTQVVSKVMNRTFEADGTGGLFPLTKVREDQRKTEIWYQLQAYLREKNS